MDKYVRQQLKKESPMPDRPCLSFTQIQAAMQAMIEQAMQLPEEPVAMAIVDPTGNLLAYNTMDNLRLYSRRHALRKAYTAAILGMDTGATPSGCTARGAASARWATPSSRSDREAWSYQGWCDSGRHWRGRLSSGQRDEDLARLGLNAMRL